MENSSEAINCWDYWLCPDDVKINCKVFKEKQGQKCYFLMEKFEPCKLFYNKLKSCLDCDWALSRIDYKRKFKD